MNHAETILHALDRHLTRHVPLVLYGRAALALGFDHPPEEACRSLDVDVILTLAQADQLDGDDAFWDALDATNRELAPSGLYVTHLFVEDQVILRPQWQDYLVPIHFPGLRHLRLSRPHLLDLLLTKMMRGADPQDMADAAFLLSQPEAEGVDFHKLFSQARVPDVPEIRALFNEAQPVILRLA
jgi:hypothetical protein